jgi:hypothetical protein
MLYCQQGWDPGAARISVAPMIAGVQSGSKVPHGESCTQQGAGETKGAKGAPKQSPPH